MTYNVRNIAIALVLAGIAAFLVIAYTSNVQKQAHNSQQTTKVLEATTDVPAGTSVKDAIAGGQLSLRPVVSQDVIAGALTSTTVAGDKDLVTTQNLYAGQQVTTAMFTASLTSPIVTQIHGTQRAIQIPVDSNAMMETTLKAGDHVDMVGTYTVHPATGADFIVSRIIVRNVPVLQVSDSTSGAKVGGGGNSNPYIIVSVPDTVVPTINFTLASEGGGTSAGADGLWLVERPQNGAQNGLTTIATLESVLGSGLNATQLKAALQGNG
jgi:Flp pilus assembly protein CpaB